jgi:hypothetical protein
MSINDLDARLVELERYLGRQWDSTNLSNFWTYIGDGVAATVGIAELPSGEYAYLLDVIDRQEFSRSNAWILPNIDTLLWELTDHDLPYVSILEQK